MRRLLLPLCCLILWPALPCRSAGQNEPFTDAARLLEGGDAPAARLLLRDHCLAQMRAGHWQTVLAAATLLREKTGAFPEYYRPWLEQAVSALQELADPAAMFAAARTLFLLDRMEEAAAVAVKAGDRLSVEKPQQAAEAARFLAGMGLLDPALQIAVSAGRNAETRRDAVASLDAARFLLEHGLGGPGRRFANNALAFSAPDWEQREATLTLLERHFFSEDAVFWRNRTADGAE